MWHKARVPSQVLSQPERTNFDMNRMRPYSIYGFMCSHMYAKPVDSVVVQ